MTERTQFSFDPTEFAGKRVSKGSAEELARGIKAARATQKWHVRRPELTTSRQAADMSSSSFGIASGIRGARLEVTGPSGDPLPLAAGTVVASGV